ncbi:hypothetical protein AGMMS49949_04910 [Alphaproteobacteria bacterium]|nr:hypothetical protein AGMMS49949_04910 [Alphaproteobacteria bacterium]GHS96477.1 hypothetical protein AGMMS50296_2650 [Alphaproteobacteria bacterium]
MTGFFDYEAKQQDKTKKQVRVLKQTFLQICVLENKIDTFAFLDLQTPQRLKEDLRFQENLFETIVSEKKETFLSRFPWSQSFLYDLFQKKREWAVSIIQDIFKQESENRPQGKGTLSKRFQRLEAFVDFLIWAVRQANGR